MKTEAEVFFSETKPFIDTLVERVNPQFCLNMTWNYPYLEKLINSRDLNMPIAEPGSKNTPAIVIGSGPSLDVCMPFLNEARQAHSAPIFTTASQVWSLYYMGVTPDFVTQHDPWARSCPVCGPDLDKVERTHVYYTEDGELYCMGGHHITGEQRDQVVRGTNVHRWCPEIGCTVLAHPGVQNENLQWADFQNNGQMFLNNFNPNIGPYDTRSITRGQVFGHAAEEFGSLPEGTHTDEAWKAMLVKMINAPGFYEPQDIPIWLAIILFGAGNPLIKEENKLRIGAAYAPSTTMQNAILAYMMGYNPIYYVGYDLCNWNHYGYHRKFQYDGTELYSKGQAKDPPKLAAAENGFGIDYVKIGEKYAMAGYYQKKVHGHYALPGMQIAEVIADGTPGNLEFFPRIDIKDFAKGQTRGSSQDKIAKQIASIMRERKIGANWK